MSELTKHQLQKTETTIEMTAAEKSKSSTILVMVKNDQSCVCKDEDFIEIEENETDIQNCTICFMEIELNENKTVLDECGHIFHSKCIRLWMKNKRTCPYCAGFSLLREEYPPLK